MSIKSKKFALSKMRKGMFIERGNHSGYFLTEGPVSTRRRISAKVVRVLISDGDVERTDDRTSRVGETWGIPS